MKQIVLTFILIIFACASHAYDGLDTPFTHKSLSKGDKHVLQAMLARAGSYKSRLDGAWGRGSQSALELALGRKKNPSWRDVATFAKSQEALLRQEDWRVFSHKNAGVSYLLPASLVERVETGQGVVYKARNNTMEVSSDAHLAPLALAMHENLRRQGRGGQADYSINRDAVFVSSVSLPNGVDAYARSEQLSGINFGTVIVRWTKDAAGMAQLVVSSMRKGGQRSITMPDGVLKRAVLDLSRPTPKPVLPGIPGLDWLDDPVAEPEIPQSQEPVRATGLGVFINNTDLLASGQAVGRCKQGSMRHANGMPLRAIASLDGLGLVILTSSLRTEHWMRIGGPGLTREATELAAIGVAQNGWESRNLRIDQTQLLGGVDVGNGRTRFVASITASRRVSGAPILDSSGRLAGMILGDARIEGLTRAQRRELRAYSFATSSAELPEALRAKNILFERGGRAKTDIARAEAAVAPLYCAQ